jgi:GNAT superfamily N-acetyltransferase
MMVRRRGAFEMNVEIKKLTSDLADDYVKFFDVTPHDDDISGSKCYCVCWCSADHRVETDFSTQEKRRELAKQYVENGTIQGYLAYYDGQVVGWCNANTKSSCLQRVSWLRFMQSANAVEKNLNDKAKSIFCFVIAPDMQRKGVATRLLKYACADAASDGFDFVEAYPKKEFVSIARDFMGPAEMYRKCGFAKVADCDDMVIMRKELHK